MASLSEPVRSPGDDQNHLASTNGPSRPPSATYLATTPLARPPWLLAAGFLLLHLSQPLVWNQTGPQLWFPPVGVGLVLVAWLGYRAAWLLLADGVLVGLWAWALGATTVWGSGWQVAAGATWDGLLQT